MSINRIQENSPETALTERLRRLERNLREFKQGVQYPTVLTTQPSTISFSTTSSWAINGGTGQPDKNILMQLHSPTGKRLFAIPEFSLHWGNYGAPGPEDEANFILSGDDRHFPGGNKFVNWDALPQWYKDVVPDNGFGRNHVDVNWWYDWLWSFIEDGDEVAHVRIRLDSALDNYTFPPGTGYDWDGHAWTFYAWWRYLSPGAEVV